MWLIKNRRAATWILIKATLVCSVRKEPPYTAFRFLFQEQESPIAPICPNCIIVSFQCKQQAYFLELLNDNSCLSTLIYDTCNIKIAKVGESCRVSHGTHILVCIIRHVPLTHLFAHVIIFATLSVTQCRPCTTTQSSMCACLHVFHYNYLVHSSL